MDVLKGSITKNYLHFLLPTLLASISSSLYCLADVFFIAQGSGAMGLAALNICMPIFEISATIIEGIIYSKCLTNKKINGYLLSVILNLSSYFIGLIINYIIW